MRPVAAAYPRGAFRHTRLGGVRLGVLVYAAIGDAQ